VNFRILESFRAVETIATGRGIRELRRIVKAYGNGRWRKRKGITRIQMMDNTILEAELHWYEAHGIGKREYKIKRVLRQG
jgi:hypothetical protein